LLPTRRWRARSRKIGTSLARTQLMRSRASSARHLKCERSNEPARQGAGALNKIRSLPRGEASARDRDQWAATTRRAVAYSAAAEEIDALVACGRASRRRRSDASAVRRDGTTSSKPDRTAARAPSPSYKRGERAGCGAQFEDPFVDRRRHGRARDRGGRERHDAVIVAGRRRRYGQRDPDPRSASVCA